MAQAAAITADDWDLEFKVNTRGVFLGCQAALRAFAGRSGAIVNIASNAGKVGFPNMAAYNATKAAVINLTRSLAREWAPLGVNVNAVCPGSVATPMLMEVADQLSAETGRARCQHVLRRHGAGATRPPCAADRGRARRCVPALRRGTIIRGQSINVDGGDTPY